MAPFRLQKLALRLIANLKRRESSIPFCNQHHILGLPEIYTHSAATFMYKFKNSLLPCPFDKFFLDNRDFHRYPTRTSALIRIPLVKTKMAENFIIKSGAHIWNNISTEIDVNTIIGPFKTRLKLYLIGKHY
jgi:hypothetical protein